MNQLIQKFKSGKMTIQEMPMPVVSAGMVLVQNHYSLISAGTEGSTVRTARKGLIGKAKERPQQVKQVIDALKKQGPVQTYRAVMKKLDAYSLLGYSSAGVVIEVGEGVKDFAVGDKVACAGAGYANHAEVVCVPENLCVKLDDSADLKFASYNTLGAIALQGIRQADLRLGEHCAVIGLGLIGQLTCLMLRVSGVKTFGIDIDSDAVETAKKYCADVAFVRSEQDVAKQINNLTNGIGVDAVIITAATSSLDPVNFAGQIARKKGRVVVVGSVPTGFDRNPYYYEKELELKMSCSYGPGRYDLNYEEKGIDYPVGYIRWTENRNMQAFQDLIHRSSIDLSYLTTHEFLLDDAVQAYDMIVNKNEPFLGIVLKYDTDKEIKRERVIIAPDIKPQGKVGIAFIGAGSYAQGNLLPNIPKGDSGVICRSVMTKSGTSSKRVAEKFGFESCTSDIEDIMSDDKVNTVFIATRHDSHADYVLKALKAGKNVFVEKPLCLKEEELADILQVMKRGIGESGEKDSLDSKFKIQNSKMPFLMVGFNRRFAPLALKLKEKIAGGPVSMLYRINAGDIPSDTWIQDKEMGGGRIIGEVCHFIDFMTFFASGRPVRVFASAMPDPHGLNDTVNINLEFANGSIGTVSYFANGSKNLPKEYFEIYSSGMTGIIRDFKELNVYGSGRSYRKKLLNQNKGQATMVKAFIENIKAGGQPILKPDEIFGVTRATFAVIESLKNKKAIAL